MSELKAFDVGLGRNLENGSPCVIAFDADRNPRLLDEEVYLKSEADKVIAEQETENRRLKEQVHDYAQGLYVMQARAEKELRHQKYKRCLAMAKWCKLEIRYADYVGAQRRYIFACKWHKRWLELAEKFKPNKSTAQQGKGNNMEVAMLMMISFVVTLAIFFCLEY